MADPVNTQLAYDLLIKGGKVVDPSQGLSGIMDVAMTAGKVAAIQPEIPAVNARETLDATGMIVTPGLIDLHVHAYWGVSCYGMEPDIGNISRGVTTAVDAGSAGARTFPGFRRYVMERADTRLYALINISSMGMIAPHIREVDDMRWLDVKEAVRCALDNRDLIIGVKCRPSNTRVIHDDIEIMKRTTDVAEGIGGFVMVHVKTTTHSLDVLTAMLRPGDVVTHAFHGAVEGGILDKDGKVIEGLRADQKRGVIFDVGHGSGSFSFAVAQKALEQGFDIGNISSDLWNDNFDKKVFDQVTTLSKFLNMGMTLEQVVSRSTDITARIMKMKGRIGTLRPGAEGDASILAMDEGDFTFHDSGNKVLKGTKKLRHAKTVKGGKVYRPWLKPTG
ncbi:MAG: amidohydrolase/deacetylase family metallohydrolase [SAR202 cluster bacterium]|nr:amidohydrolase/deacetylase family metallohydrolase [SAR202 cluster bacterium]